MGSTSNSDDTDFDLWMGVDLVDGTKKEDDNFLETLGRRGDLLGGLSLMGVVTVVGVTGGTVMGVVWPSPLDAFVAKTLKWEIHFCRSLELLAFIL